MTNVYYTKSNTYTPHTLARGEQVDAEFALIEDGFDKLPDLTALSRSTIHTGTDTGVANAYKLDDLAAAPSAPETLVHTTFIPAHSSTTDAPTLDFNGWGPKLIRGADGAVIPAGEFKAGRAYTLAYTGTNWALVGLNGEAAGGGGFTDIQILALLEPLKQPTIDPGEFYWAFESGPWVNGSNAAIKVPTSTIAAGMTGLGFRRPFAAEYG